MRSIFLFLFAMAATVNIEGQDKILSLYEGSSPGSKGNPPQERKTISDYGTPILYNVTEPELWHYSAQGKGIKPAIIICPGGGYRVEAYEHEGSQVAEWLSQLGYEAFVLKYRLPEDSLFSDATFVPLADARRAIALVREKASEWSINPDKIGILGFSAGGHLAASASNLFNQRVPLSREGNKVRPDFSILVYPVISMADTITHQGSREALLGKNASDKLVQLFSLEKQITANTPPTIIIHAKDDEGVSVENTIRYAKALRSNNVAVKEVLLEKGGHGFGFRKESPAFIWTEYLEHWLKEDIE
ncbi:alpha/beta hydrolase [Marinilabilia rubra]|uniref:Alpha/beta hydrolase n=1 Tax=Marinilabilia rubra TaxID=2162893 RepID=A0A2U2BDR7_9BACT|nr:alpha/beta hydrolase [Marinilabilia rubra]PWE01215.1 alpha/beta hydrolase [Marinilabilia rubra]